MLPGKDTTHKSPLKVIRTGHGLLLDGVCLFRIVSCMNKYVLFLMYIVLRGIGQFKDTQESRGNALQTPCDSHFLA